MSYIGNQPTTVAFPYDTFSGNGSQTAYTMQLAPANTASVMVFVSGVKQDPSTYSVSGTTLTFSAAPPSGTNNISAIYLGIPASGVVNTAYRTVTEFTATAGQTSFSVPSYTVGYIDVFRNGVRLNSADYTATNGTTVVLTSGATAGDTVTTESFYVSSVVGAISATAGAVNSTYLLDGAVTQSKLASNVGSNGPAFAAYLSATQNISFTTYTKVNLDTEVFDTNNNFSAGRFTPTVAGYYQINAMIFLDSTVTLTTPFVVTIYKNGSQYSTNIEYVASGGSGRTMGVTSVIYFNGSTDYVELYGYINSGSGTPKFDAGSTVTYMNGAMVRAA